MNFQDWTIDYVASIDGAETGRDATASPEVSGLTRPMCTETWSSADANLARTLRRHAP